MSWTTSEAITEQILRRWSRGEILAARITGAALFPMEIRLKRPTPRDVADRFGDVRDWARSLVEARAAAGEGRFELRLETVRNRVQGSNQLPVAAIVPSEAAALRLIGKESAAARFQRLVDETLSRHAALRDWLVRWPMTALEHADRWTQILAVLDWFRAHPRPGLYLRQLDVPGVDTKFIEAHRGLLSQLLDIVLPDEAVDRTASGVSGFPRRYGLRSEAPLVRFRLLDPALYLTGFSDVSLPPEQFAGLNLPVRRAFITENRTNGLAFPDCRGSVVVFGLGYGLDRLAQIPWLRNIEVHYWGDIDTHGFGILNRLRLALPAARSLLMDRATLEAHRSLWGTFASFGRPSAVRRLRQINGVSCGYGRSKLFIAKALLIHRTARRRGPQMALAPPRVPGYEPGGRTFESCRAHQVSRIQSAICMSRSDTVSATLWPETSRSHVRLV